MVPSNRKSIRKRAFHFWGLFVALLVAALLPACCFIWTAGRQYKAHNTAWEAYHVRQSRCNELYERMNSLIAVIDDIDTDNPMIYDGQEKRIIAMKAEIDRIMGPDSSDLFLGYARINRHVLNLMNLKYTNVSEKVKQDRLEQAWEKRLGWIKEIGQQQ